MDKNIWLSAPLMKQVQKDEKVVMETLHKQTFSSSAIHILETDKI